MQIETWYLLRCLRILKNPAVFKVYLYQISNQEKNLHLHLHHLVKENTSSHFYESIFIKNYIEKNRNMVKVLSLKCFFANVAHLSFCIILPHFCVIYQEHEFQLWDPVQIFLSSIAKYVLDQSSAVSKIGHHHLNNPKIHF